MKKEEEATLAQLWAYGMESKTQLWKGKDDNPHKTALLTVVQHHTQILTVLSSAMTDL